MQWYVDIYLLKTPKHQTCTRKSWELSTHYLNSFQANAKTWSEEFWTQIQREDLQSMTSEITLGHYKLKIEIEIWAISQVKKKCHLMINFMRKSLRNSILIGNTLQNVLKIIVIIILLLVIISLIRETRKLRIGKKVIN